MSIWAKKFLHILSDALAAVSVVLALLLLFLTLPVSGYHFYTVDSGSMAPAIKLGSLVAVKPDQDYRRGDIITFQTEKTGLRPVTHRIINVTKKTDKTVFKTKGDANEDPDIEDIPAQAVLGKVYFAVPWFGHVINFIKKPLGFLIIVISPLALMIFSEVRQKFKNKTVVLKPAEELKDEEPKDETSK